MGLIVITASTISYIHSHVKNKSKQWVILKSPKSMFPEGLCINGPITVLRGFSGE